MVANGYPEVWREGNAYADAAAKEGRTEHPRDMDCERVAIATFALVMLVARFVADMHLASMTASDVPDCPTRSRQEACNLRVARTMPPSVCHAIVPDGARWRCLWCFRTSASSTGLGTGPCSSSLTHSLWRADDLLICSACGAYSGWRTCYLSRPCNRKPTMQDSTNVRRVFVHRKHPVQETGVSILSRVAGSDKFPIAGGCWECSSPSHCAKGCCGC